VFREFLRNGESALMTPVGDGHALAAAMARVARDELLRARLRAGGRAVAQAYGWDASAAVHERLYRGLAVSERSVAR
jgi:glycosyltransferase involved in cell wall biosynthesis